MWVCLVEGIGAAGWPVSLAAGWRGLPGNNSRFGIEMVRDWHGDGRDGMRGNAT